MSRPPTVCAGVGPLTPSSIQIATSFGVGPLTPSSLYTVFALSVGVKLAVESVSEVAGASKAHLEVVNGPVP